MAFCTECGAGVEQHSPIAPIPGLTPTEPVPVVPPPPESRRPARRSRLLVGLVAAVAVVGLGTVGATYALTSRDEPEQKTDAAATGSATPTPTAAEAPGAEAVTEVRRARFRLVVVGCPRGNIADAVSVGESHVLVPSSVVQGASKVLLTGTATPEPAYVLGVEEGAGVAVLKVPALAEQGGGTIAADDPVSGGRVVVVGASEQQDIPATVRSGEDGTRVHADSALPLGGVIAGSDGDVVGMVGPDGLLLPASKLTEAKQRFADSAPTELTNCARPSGPDDTTALVAERPTASGAAADVVDRLVTYYTAVNQRELRKAHSMRAKQSDYQGFADGFRSTYNVGMVIGPPKVDGDRATVRVSFTSTQNAEQSPDDSGQTCTRWKVTHGMEKRGDTWLVGAARGSTYRPCE